jgi:hypothetical protein
MDLVFFFFYAYTCPIFFIFTYTYPVLSLPLNFALKLFVKNRTTRIGNKEVPWYIMFSPNQTDYVHRIDPRYAAKATIVNAASR